MTETASGQSGPNGQPAGAGEIRRIHTREGVHPYDEVTWERRDVVMTNWRDGSVNFEQRGVEFPDFWSVNAANIVTTKYFRGAVGTAQREWSLKQLVDRVVGTYGAAGREHGYFGTEEDAQIFEHELSTPLSIRYSVSIRRSGSMSAHRPRSRCQRALSWLSTTRWTRFSNGIAKRASYSKAGRAQALTFPGSAPARNC